MKSSGSTQLTFCFLFSILTLQLFSCKKENNVTLPPVIDNTGAIRQPGIHDGSAVSEKSVGAAGGTLQSSDGALNVVIPPGALKAAQSFTIKRINNTNPLGKIKAYRIEPHVQFDKDVEVIFNIPGDQSLQTKGIAYQDSTGIWRAIGGTLPDGNRKISVKTNHFSDWSLFDWFMMSPANATVQPGQTLELELLYDEDLLAPLVDGEEKAIGNPTKVAGRFIKKWELIGPGSLSIDGATALYHAPDGVPDPPHATVNTELDLGVKGKFILVTNIDIIYSAVQLQHDNHPEIIYKSATAFVNNGQITISAGNDDGLRVLINWQGGLGYHAFGKDVSAQFGWFPNDADRYVHFYTDDLTHTDVPSAGGINITDMGDTDGFVKGEFEIRPIGKVTNTRTVPAGQLKGKFQVRLHFNKK